MVHPLQENFPLIKNKINLTGTLSYLSSSGLSEFSNYGLSLGSTIIISKAFKLNLMTLSKARSTADGTELSNFCSEIIHKLYILVCHSQKFS